MDIKEIEKRVKTSSLMFKIRSVAQQIFDAWCKKAEEQYNLSMDFPSPDAARLKSDLQNCMISAAQSLVLDKGNDKKHIPGWSLGFFYGHIKGQLNTQWTYEYITKQSADFKEFVALKATWHYLNFDTDTVNRIGRLYDYFTDVYGIGHFKKTATPMEPPAQLDTASQITASSQKEQTEATLQPVVSLEAYSNAREAHKSPIEHILLNGLEKEIDRRINLLLRQYKKQCVPDIDALFDDNAIIDMIGSEHFAL